MKVDRPTHPSRVRISPAEWRWVLLWTVMILLFTSIPYLLGWALAAGGELTFGGFVLGVEDLNSYLAKMGQGARGHWLFRIVHTSESHDGVFVYLFYLLLGKLAAILPGQAANLPLRMIWVYHLARWLFSTVLMLVIYRFVAEFLSDRSDRRLAWSMVSLGGGLSWLVLALGQGGDWLGSPPLDFILPEGFTFLVIFSLPHIALGRALLLGGVLAWLWGMARTSVRPVLAAGLLWSAMAVIVPFYPLVVGAVVGVTLLLWWWQRGSLPRKEIGWSLLAGLISSPMVMYSAWIFSTDPVMKGWSEQNLVMSPHPFHFVAAYGLPALAAFLGLRWVWQERPEEKYWLLFGWVLVIPPLLYVPFNFQRRLIESYQLPLYTLAINGAGKVAWPWLKRHVPKPRLLAAVWMALIFVTSLTLVFGMSMTVAAQASPIFHQPAEVEVAYWLTEHVQEGDLVLSDFATGNFLPGWSPVRTYYGHGPETINFQAKKANVERFFATKADDVWRHSFLMENQVMYVLQGPAERELGSFDPTGVSYLRLVFDKNDWQLYQVVP